MAFTIDDMQPSPNQTPVNNRMKEFDLPSKEFVGYDPKGTTTVTGSERKVPETENAKQENINEEAVEETVTLSPKISALARKEQAQRQRELSLKRRERELEEKLAKAERFDKLQAKIKDGDYSAADELGLDYDKLTNHEIEKRSAKDPQEEKYRSVEEKLVQLAKKQEELEVREYQANQGLWKQEISNLVKDNEEFSTIKEWGAEDSVLQHINDSFEEDGVELSSEEAAREIEAALVERLSGHQEKLSKVSKLKKLGEKLGPPKASPKTLTQTMTVTSQKQSKKPFHLMSESEQLAEAIRRVEEEKLNRR